MGRPVSSGASVAAVAHGEGLVLAVGIEYRLFGGFCCMLVCVCQEKRRACRESSKYLPVGLECGVKDSKLNTERLV